jgi:predicted molibdopterin-dependent oxidoreductase YjgC
VLPAAAYAEKDGTFTNTERRVQKLNRAILPPGDSKPDWWIVCEIAKRLGGSGFDFGSTPEIMDEIARVTPGYGGISHERLEKGGIQWPCPAKGHPGTQILHTERCPTPSGKGKFVPLEYKPSAELPDAEYPFILTTCRSLYHYHTGTMTRKVDGLNCLKGHESVVMSGDDAAKLGISDGEVIRVVSRRGNVDAAAQISDGIQPGVVAMTFHFSECPTNQLTNSALDPVAKIPEAKVCAVRLEKLKVGAPPSCAKAH